MEGIRLGSTPGLVAITGCSRRSARHYNLAEQLRGGMQAMLHGVATAVCRVTKSDTSRIGNPARSLVFAFLLAYAIAATIAVTTHWYFDDSSAYWNAALRLRAGEPLYLPGDTGDPTLYRYAPWFAWAWVPLTYLPHDPVMLAWGILLAAAAVWLIWPARQPAAIALALLCLPDLLRVTSSGNVQPLLLAAIAYGVTSRWGPLLIGMAASLKGWPLLFAGVWWRTPGRIALAAGVTALLVAPALAYDLAGYPTDRQLLTPGTLSIALVFARLLRQLPVAQQRPSVGS